MPEYCECRWPKWNIVGHEPVGVGHTVWELFCGECLCKASPELLELIEVPDPAHLSNKHLEEMRRFALELPADFGPLFGYDVVALIDAYKEITDV